MNHPEKKWDKGEKRAAGLCLPVGDLIECTGKATDSVQIHEFRKNVLLRGFFSFRAYERESFAVDFFFRRFRHFVYGGGDGRRIPRA